ncbi:MAG: hypothetical protein ACRDK2_07995 [Solirubrobacteraceae bacterium]
MSQSRTGWIRTALYGTPALIAATAIALSTSGCGASSVDPIAQAAEATSRLPGTQITFSEQLSSPSLPQQIVISGTGYINQSGHTGQLSMKFPQLPGAPSSLSNATIQMVFQYPVFYMKFPQALSEKLPGGKPWMKFNVQSASQAAGINLLALSSTTELDPTQYLNFLRGASGEVTELGRETVNGVGTTRYRATIQIGRIVEHLPAAQRAGAEAAVRQLQKLGGLSSIPVEVWIDDAHRVRQERIDIHKQVSGTPINATVTVNYLSFGSAKPITAPPPSQVYDITALATRGLRSAAGGH